MQDTISLKKKEIQQIKSTFYLIDLKKSVVE